MTSPNIQTGLGRKPLTDEDVQRLEKGVLLQLLRKNATAPWRGSNSLNVLEGQELRRRILLSGVALNVPYLRGLMNMDESLPPRPTRWGWERRDWELDNYVLGLMRDGEWPEQVGQVVRYFKSHGKVAESERRSAEMEPRGLQAPQVVVGLPPHPALELLTEYLSDSSPSSSANAPDAAASHPAISRAATPDSGMPSGGHAAINTVESYWSPNIFANEDEARVPAQTSLTLHSRNLDEAVGNSESSSPLSSPISSPTPSYPKYMSAVTTQQSASSLHSVRAPSSLRQRSTFSGRASSALRSSHSSDADAEGETDDEEVASLPAPMSAPEQFPPPGIPSTSSPSNIVPRPLRRPRQTFFITLIPSSPNNITTSQPGDTEPIDTHSAAAGRETHHSTEHEVDHGSSYQELEWSAVEDGLFSGQEAEELDAEADAPTSNGDVPMGDTSQQVWTDEGSNFVDHKPTSNARESSDGSGFEAPTDVVLKVDVVALGLDLRSPGIPIEAAHTLVELPGAQATHFARWGYSAIMADHFCALLCRELRPYIRANTRISCGRMVNGRIHYSQVAVTDDAGTLRVERPDYELELMRLQHDHQSRSLQGITRWVAFRVDMDESATQAVTHPAPILRNAAQPSSKMKGKGRAARRRKRPTTTYTAEERHAALLEWLMHTHGEDPVVLDMRSCPGDNSKKEPGRLLDWVETTGSLYAQGPLPNDAPPAAAGQHVTKAVLEEFLGRGHDWIKDATRCHALMDTDNQDIRDMTSTLLRDGVHLGAGGLVKRLRTIVGDTVFWAKVEAMKKRERSQNIAREAASSPSSTSSERSPRHRPKKSRAHGEVELAPRPPWDRAYLLRAIPQNLG
ncbi:hypothetical protein C8Q76DRAFT_792841 [Earliella scabrosa]|nr:hypothetical protein C8Q76DRAFT_792841 [Earliella scabrosa]